MSFELLKANLNLYAVLQNLEDLVEHDPEQAQAARNWDISLQFTVVNGPKVNVTFNHGTCQVRRGKHPSPTIHLLFATPWHLNKMFDGKAIPIPVGGFTKLGFLAKEFTKLTDKLQYYLKPTDELLKDPEYLALNTRLTLNTAAFAVPELAALDPVGVHAARGLVDGTIVLRIMPNGPAAHIRITRGCFEAEKGDVSKPTASMSMKNLEVANAFLNNKMDAFTAIASGDVAIKGLIPQLDAMSLILDRVNHYLN